MVALAAQLDSTRPSTCAIAGSEDQAVNWLTKVSALNKYLGWYRGKMEDFRALARSRSQEIFDARDWRERIWRGRLH